ncbi:MAG: hypothetical protein COU08_01750 [Candidatus Harrisonbacteria bacterium CG10_big_fil_rev_8_21_14_0_10_42_17]|uniref:Lipid-A-disaccharide synthase n=1 Tax=Candidatus Harrisonbacteria bacterium CG10_big_fil_rev_8_21_14_0_10_42_17 TaxID=1974584 RepID=A0A2M6WIH0_9BACT|nr:MAG: hypothetical protein COU08_01750 [Candidatus Harrisonbacteria bacterium CG10_big_fil_rev_8_21_14_0_10_42_17]
MKTIFFTIATRARINFILRTDIFETLKERGFKLVIISPFGEDEKFISEFGGDNVIFEPLPCMGRLGLLVNFWRNTALEISHPILTQTRFVHSRIIRRFVKAKKNIVKIKGMVRRIILGMIPPQWRSNPKFWDGVEKFFIKNKHSRALFKKHQPSVVILASAGAEGIDTLFVTYAKRFNVPTVAVDNNIDVFEFRYFSTPRSITKWALFSNVQQEEAKKIQKIPADKLIITGPARYDHYFRNFKPMSRNDFFKQIGADPNKKLITYGAKTPKMFPHNDEVMNSIVNGIQSGTINKQSQLFVRFDSGHNPEQYNTLLEKIVWESADKKSHRNHVANLLYYSDVVISVGSTFNIEACFVHTPSIWIGFGDIQGKVKREDSYRLAYDIPLYDRILDTEAIKFVETPESLVEQIQKYLKDKTLDEEKRKVLVEQEYSITDGRSGERIANLIESISR